MCVRMGVPDPSLRVPTGELFAASLSACAFLTLGDLSTHTKAL